MVHYGPYSTMPNLGEPPARSIATPSAWLQAIRLKNFSAQTLQLLVFKKEPIVARSTK